MSGEIDTLPGKILQPDEPINNEKLMQVLMGLQVRLASGAVTSREISEDIMSLLARQEDLQDLQDRVDTKADIERVNLIDEKKADKSVVAGKASVAAVHELEQGKADRDLGNATDAAVKSRHLDPTLIAQLNDGTLTIEGNWDPATEDFPVNTSGGMEDYAAGVSTWRITHTHTWMGVDYQATGKLIWNGGTSGTAADWDLVSASPADIPDDFVSAAKLAPVVRARLLPDLQDDISFLVDPEVTGWAVAFADAMGNIAAGITASGDFKARTIDASILDMLDMRMVADMGGDWALAVSDNQRRVASGVRADGQVLPEGGGGGEEPSPPVDPVVVYRAYIEVHTDPSHDAVVTWHSDSAAGKLLEYRLQGASQWVAAAGRTRAFPFRDEKIHSVVLQGLSPDSIYEFRVPGAPGTRKFRTCPNRLDRPLKMVWASDYQVYSFGASSRMGVLGANIRDDAPDLFVLGGDYINDDGVRNTLNSARWAAFLDGIETHHKDADGCLLPMVVLAGNHEAEPGQAGKDNSYGYLEHLFSWGYDPVIPTTGGRGHAYFRIGRELLFIGLESSHATHWDDQIDWFRETLEVHAGAVKHVVVASHRGAFDAGRNVSAYLQGRFYRREIWPLLQDLPNCKFVLAGHQHIVLATGKLKMDIDPSLSAEENDRRYYTDPDGIRQIGVGPWGGGQRSIQDFVDDFDSTIDGTSFVDAALGSNRAIGDIQDADLGGFWHLWLVTLTEDSITGECRNMYGTNYITYQETI